MDELYQIETRRRSRSKTPFLRSNCDNEQCTHTGEEGHIHHGKKSPVPKKIPKITSIIEESIEVSSSSSSSKNNKPNQSGARPKTSQLNAVTATSDYSSNSSEDTDVSARKNKLSSAITSTTTVITKTQSISTRNKINSRDKNKNLIQYYSPPSVSIATIKSKESKQNVLNTEFEKSGIKTSTPIFKKASTKTAEINVEDDLSDHIAYQEYRVAGEYWKKYPKTDYTYSKLSPHRREVAPGVVAMPNMSRKSLEKHNERLNYMIQHNPEQEAYIRRRYETTNYRNTQNVVNNFLYDSQDEVDLTEFDNNNVRSYTYLNGSYSDQKRYVQSSWITNIMTYIVTTFNGVCAIFSKQNQDESYLYRTGIDEQQHGILRRLRTAVTSSISSVFNYIYLLISSILYMDTHLLKSHSADNKNKKRFLLLLLILLPLFLLSAIYYWTHPNEPFPPITFSQISNRLPSVNFSQIADNANFDQIKATAFEKMDNLRLWSEDYIDYLKTVSQNVATETQKIFQENFSN